MRDLRVIAPPEHLARLIEIQYGDIAAYQWVRETWKNAQEAGATRLRYGIEWMGVESKGIYRRYIADNGCGMDPDELVAFFSQIGESSKAVGTRWDNLGWGAKLNLMPWNPLGIYVISWQEQDGSLIHIRKNPDGYALREFETEAGPAHVVEPYSDPELGVDFAEIGPDWVREEGGTIFLLAGSEDHPHTILGDPNKDEAKRNGIGQYLNTRLASTEMDITVEDFIHSDITKWPKSYAEARATVTGGDRREYQENRRIQGVRHYLEDRKVVTGKSPDIDGSTIVWWLQKKAPSGGEAPAPPTSFVAFEYDGEVYSVTEHRSALQAFGIFSKDIFKRTAIIITLPLSEKVGTTIDRTRIGYADTGKEVSFHAWADWFAQAANFPEALFSPPEPQQAQLENGRFVKLLSEKYGERLRRTYLVLREGARTAVGPIFHKKTKTRGPIVNLGETHPGGKTERESSATPDAGPAGGNGRGVKYEAAADIPQVTTDDSAYEKGMAAVIWNSSRNEAVIYTQHPVVRSQVEYWQGLYPRGTENDVERSVIDWYRQDIALRIAHVESLAELYNERERGDMLTEAALTASLLGLAKDDAFLKPKLGGLLQTKSLA